MDGGGALEFTEEQWTQLGADIDALARRLTCVYSPSRTPGEREAGALLHRHLQELLAAATAQQGGSPVRYSLESIPASEADSGDSLLSWLPGRADSGRSVLLLGHFDTVPAPDGELSGLHQSGDFAAIAARLAEHPDPEISGHARMDEWRFGRGWLDMKGGVAAITELFIAIARAGGLSCGLALLLCADEEAESRGIRTALPRLKALLDERGQRLTAVLNADYCSPQAWGEPGPRLHSGTVGKLLAGITVLGAPSHAGSPFEGANAAALGGFLAQGLDGSARLLDGEAGRWLMPPSVLSLDATKSHYDVTLAETAQLQLNVFFAHDAQALWLRLQRECARLARLWDAQRRREYNNYCRRADLRPRRSEARPLVLSFSSAARELLRKPGGEEQLRDMHHAWRGGDGDPRVRALRFAEVLGLCHTRRPLVILTLLEPFYPAAGGRPSAQSRRLAEVCGLDQLGAYPFISDLSFFSFSPELRSLGADSPGGFDPALLELSHALSAPVCNIGPWGHGAHTDYERVYWPYVERELPRQLLAALNELSRSLAAGL